MDLGGRRILHDVSFEAGAGEKLVLLGPNGAGKTTLLRAIAGLHPAATGWIRLAGHDPADEPRRRVALSASGVSIEHPGLPSSVRTDEYLSWWATIHGLPLRRSDLHALLESWALPVGVAAETLSQGQRQLLQVARCLLHDPRILLLDEPGSALDPDAREILQTGLRAWSDRTGGILLLSSHHLDEALSLADRILVLGAGRLRLDGDPQERIDAPSFSRLLRMEPGTDRQDVDHLLDSLDLVARREPVAQVRGCPAWRVACRGGEHDHPQLLEALGARGLRVRSLDRDRQTLAEFWQDALVRPPLASSAPEVPPSSVALPAREMPGTLSTVRATAAFHLRLVLRERRMVLPILLVETFYLGSMWLAGLEAFPAPQRTGFVLVAGILPLGIGSSLAADTFAGERERRSLETLLTAPIAPMALFAGKALAAHVPGQILSSLAATAACLALLASGAPVPTSTAMLLILLLLPAMGAAATATGVVASRRARTVRAAAQISSLTLLPLLLVAQILPAVLSPLPPPGQVLGWMGAALSFAGIAAAISLASVRRSTPQRLFSGR